MTATLDFPEPSSLRDAPASEAYGPADAIATAYDVHRNASRGILSADGFAWLGVFRPEDHKAASFENAPTGETWRGD